jgi:hypothetical protein
MAGMNCRSPTPSFLAEKLGAECGDLQGLRELTANGIEAIDAVRAGQGAGSSGIWTGSARSDPTAGCASCR